MPPGRYLPTANEDEDCPEYSVAIIGRSNTVTSSSSYTTSASSNDAHWISPVESPRSSPALRSFASHSSLRRLPTPKALTPISSRSTPPPRIRPERYIYTYSLNAAGAPLRFFISVESPIGKPRPGNYIFRLSIKVHDVERQLGEPVTLRLSVDPRTLDFAVFLFPGKKTVLPAGCLFSLRVWLRVNGVDHRIFGEDELWVGKDPDFTTVEEASFARIRSVTPDAQIYDAVVGRARVQFIVRWQHLNGRLYKYTVEYDAGGVGALLIDDLRLLIDGDPRLLTFFIYTVPVRSVPSGASHRLRIWLRSFVQPTPSANGDPISHLLDSSYVYQRVWKTDTFKIGGRLDFDALGPKLIMGTPAPGGSQTVLMEGWECQSPPAVGYQQDSKDPLLELA
ncbi:hypothetical protein C8F01DRAFT_1161064 [Mycena amicta]|nr:hypothetical protein C8F01DRAFT_1161064 [Mycena amicta]